MVHWDGGVSLEGCGTLSSRVSALQPPEVGVVKTGIARVIDVQQEAAVVVKRCDGSAVSHMQG